MEHKKLIDVLHLAEKLKDTTRHCYSSGGRRESVAEHCWRAALMAYFIKDEFPGADMDKVILMCLVHDLGEAFTGDIPCFDKTSADEDKEAALLSDWLVSLPAPYAQQLQELFLEMEQQQTLESKIFKAIDGMEAVLQHNESDLSTWIPHEFHLNLVYAEDKVAFSPYMTALRKQLQDDTKEKISKNRLVEQQIPQGR